MATCSIAGPLKRKWHPETSREHKKKKSTPLQLAALEKAREALIKKHTCERCGDEDPSRGLNRESQERIYSVLRDGVKHRYCISCKIYYQWLETRREIEQRMIDLFAQKTPFWLIDFETTGKLESQHCQVVEIAIIDQDGNQVFYTLCRPDVSMPERASKVNGITDDLLIEAPTFVQIWPTLQALLSSTAVPIYAWNAEFDRQALLATLRRFHLQVPEQLCDKQRWRDAMAIFSRWYGEWSNKYSTYRWQKLEWACTELEIEADSHRALPDALSALKVMRTIAEQVGKYPPPAEMPYNQRYYEEW